MIGTGWRTEDRKRLPSFFERIRDGEDKDKGCKNREQADRRGESHTDPVYDQYEDGTGRGSVSYTHLSPVLNFMLLGMAFSAVFSNMISEAVSYTHLDVYKRQEYGWSGRRSR